MKSVDNENNGLKINYIKLKIKKTNNIHDDEVHIFKLKNISSRLSTFKS